MGSKEEDAARVKEFWAWARTERKSAGWAKFISRCFLYV